MDRSVTTMNPDQAENKATQLDADLGRSSFVDRNLLYRNYPSQLLALQQQRDRLVALRDQGLNSDPILAAAVQRQLMAVSLGSSGNIPLYALGNQSRLGGSLIVSHGGVPPTLIHGSFQQGQQSSGNHPIMSNPLKQITDTISAKPSRVLMTKIPCQARGMTSDHNSITAFFEVASDTKHGQHLCCSHAGCRASGVKFRFCNFCKKPVTKQNFRSRHLHADLLEGGETIDTVVVSETPGRKRKSSGDKKEVTERKEPMRRGLIPGMGSDGNIFSLHNNIPVVGVHGSTAGERFMSLEPNGVTFPERLDTIRLSSRPGDTVKRTQRWASLLSERPHGLQDDIGAWLATVLEVSDKSRDWKAEMTREAVDAKDGDQLERSNQITVWKQLLDERPEVAVGSEATDWMMKVLKVSCRDYP